jgi:hypothetical protein
MAVNIGPAPTNVPITTGQSGILTQQWFDYMNRLAAALLQVQAVANNSFGTNYLPLSSQPSLGAGDLGYVLFVTDYAHFTYWDGSAWQWLDGDRPLKFDGFASDPGTGWGLCDGSAYDYLVVGGATLTTSSFTTPNLKGTAAYLKSGAAYSGTISAASGSTATGSTGTGGTGTGTTGTGTTGSTGVSGTTGADSANGLVRNDVASVNVALAGHTHTFNAGSHTHTVPGLSVPSLSVPSLSVPALAVGSIDVSRLTTLPYVRL